MAKVNAPVKVQERERERGTTLPLSIFHVNSSCCELTSEQMKGNIRSQCVIEIDKTAERMKQAHMMQVQ